MTAGSEAPPVIDPEITPPSREQRRKVGELVEVPEESPEKEQVTELTDEERADFSRLLTVGRRTKRVDIMGHSVVIQTLKTGDEMRIGLYTKPYLETQGFARAYQVAVCAAGIREVDGAPLWSSLSENPDEAQVFAKCTEVVDDYYPIVITQVYNAIMDLEREFAELARKLGKLPG